MFKKVALPVILVAVAGLAHADLITNGTFAAPGITTTNNSWSVFNSINGWYAESFTNIDGHTEYNGIEVGSPSRYGISGTVGNNLELNSNGRSKVSQDIAGLTAGETIDLNFLMGYRKDPNQPSVNTNKFEVLWNDQLVATYLPTSSTMTAESLNLTAVSGTNKLSFESLSPESTYGGEIENVQAQAVPEPAPFLVLGAGVGLFALLRRPSG